MGAYALVEIAFLLVASWSVYHPYFEILFWSWFGAISISIITIGSDMMRDTFDPRHIHKYLYIIPVAPLVAFVLIFFLSLFGFSTSGAGTVSTLQISLVTPNYPVLIVLSFLFGFFGKRSLDVLDQAWQRLFNDSNAAANKSTKVTTKTAARKQPGDKKSQ